MLRCLLALALLCGSAHAQLDERQQALLSAVDAGESSALELLERSVNINSGTLNFDGVREVGALFRRELESLGFQCRWIDGASFERAGHLFAERPGIGAHVLLIGHLDTVFEPSSPFQDYERVDDHHARGPGTTDMKGGIVIMLEALRALSTIDALDQLQVTVALLGDEEKAGSPIELARADLLAAAGAADIALGFEDGDGDPKTAVIARRGSTSWTLRVSGTPAHSSQIFKEEYGPGAIFEMARILDAFRRELAGEELLTFSPGLVLGGTEAELDSMEAEGTAFGKRNVIAGETVVTGDLRTISFEQLEATKKRMRAIVAESLPKTSAEIVFLDRYPPLAPTHGNRGLLSLLDSWSRAMGAGGVEAVNPRNAGAADVSFTAGRVDAAMDGLGLMGTGGHTEGETADLRTLSLQAKRTALLLLELSEDGAR